MVEPILLYCAGVFGIYNTDVLDRIQMKICKQILGVKMSTPNMAVLGESGRYPSILCEKRVLTYWIKINRNKSSLIYYFFQLQHTETYYQNCIFCANHVKSLLDSLGYGFTWYNFNDDISIRILKCRLRDQFKQEGV
jgi:hypothetical protein